MCDLLYVWSEQHRVIKVILKDAHISKDREDWNSSIHPLKNVWTYEQICKEMDENWDVVLSFYGVWTKTFLIYVFILK